MRATTAAACAALLTCAGAAIAADRGATTHTVIIEATSFQPQTLNLKRGDTVVWINKDPFPHTATSTGRFDSGSIDAGRSWKHVFGKSGDYAYVCTFHPNMKAAVRVE